MISLFNCLLIFVILYQLEYVYTLDNDQYQIGVGIADITGPSAEINMMGYAKLGQDSSGIHLRLFSRAVIVVDTSGNRLCYITADLQGITQIVKLEVVKALEKKYRNLYHHENLLISATHTHSGPGGYFQYLLYIITTQGFITDSFHSIVDGILKSIDRAHESLKPGHIYYNEGELLDSSINRSPAGYVNNPKEERDRYKYDTDKSMSILKFVDLSGKPIAMINWHAVHAVSMNNSNKLISSDNKGYASLLFEADYNIGQLPAKGPFIALFSQSNEGDSSPNTAGPRCIDTGEQCDLVKSTCRGKNEFCKAFGPGKDMFESTKIIAQKQYKKAKELFESAEIKVKGDIQYIYQNINMSHFEVKLSPNKTVFTCKPALGFSFAAGTTDGEGAPMFHQSTHKGEEPPFWNFVRDLISKPSQEMTECQNPKAILFPVGEMKFPYQWAPDLIPTQLFKIGDVVIAGLPAEFTTMSGRRVRDAINKEFRDNGENVKVVLSGLANTYSNYVATYEEYQIQRYEAGSTMYGPHTLDAYVQQFRYLATNMVKKQRIAPGTPFPNLLKSVITLKPGVIFDAPAISHNFGDVIHDAMPVYNAGHEVKVTFISAHPRNNLQLEGTYLTVERLHQNTTNWEVIATDANWETKFIWKRTNAVLGNSEATVLWDIPINTPEGKYRICHFGHHKNILQHISPFMGTSSAFHVMNDFYKQ